MKKSKLYGSRLIEDNELTITPELVTLDSIDDVTNLTFDRGNILDASSVKLYLAAISDDLATKYDTLNENVTTNTNDIITINTLLTTTAESINSINTNITTINNSLVDYGVSLEYVDNKLILKNKNSDTLSSIDLSIMTGDTYLDTVTFSNNKLIFTWNEGSSKQPITIDLSNLKDKDGNILSVGNILAQSKLLFLSKNDSDTAKGLITFMKGVRIGNYTSESGGVIDVDLITGLTYLEVDKLKVRMKAYFETLSIVNELSIAGKWTISPGGSILCTRVNITPESNYKCYFTNTQDNVKIENRFAVNDLAISKDFNIKTVESQSATNHYYWRKVLEVGEDYIVLSKTDCDTGSDEPNVGDVICLLGNTTDVDRLNALVLSSVDDLSPCVNLYSGINTYSLADKEYVSYGVNKTTNKAFMNVYGDMYFGDRPTIANNYEGTSYIKYDSTNKKVTVKGELDVTSTIGGTDINLYIRNNSMNDADVNSLITNSSVISDLLGLIDGAIETYFYSGVPTLSNLPASSWVQVATPTNKEIYTNHIGDLYYDKDTGKAYRFMLDGDTGIYSWVIITDVGITKALADSAEALSTANIKRRIFYGTPTVPYDKGDLWVDATYPVGTTATNSSNNLYYKEILYCTTLKTTGGTFSITDWSLSNNYTKISNDIITDLNGYLYIKEALANDTLTTGGLILSSLIALRDANNNILSGINGILNETSLGEGIATWWGGKMIDGLFTPDVTTTAITDYATSLIRFNGSGYLANGTISWDTNGKIHADPTSFFVGTTSIGVIASLFSTIPIDATSYSLVTKIHPTKPFDTLSADTVTATTFIGELQGNAATATKLKTPRTIWGQSFDGSGNVDGNIDINGTLHATGEASLEGDTQFGPNYVEGITGMGGKIDKDANAELESLTLRRFLQVPEIDYNRVDIKVGDKWRAPGGGVIKSVDTGNKIVTLKLEDGEIGAVEVGDICMGIFHSTTTSDNSTSNYDDSKGNRTFAGFFTCYFHIIEVLDTDHTQFKYELRPIDDNWKLSFAPCEAMNFVGYGNFTNVERQTSVYETTTYTRMLVGQNTWEFSIDNIAMQYGNLTNLDIFGLDMTGYSIYLANIYMKGQIKQVKDNGSEIKQINFLANYAVGQHVDYYDALYYNGSTWVCINKNGTNTTPSENDTINWMILAKQGSSVKVASEYQENVTNTAGTILSFYNMLFAARVDTQQPPLEILSDQDGTYITDENGNYLLYVQNGDVVQNNDWILLIDMPTVANGESLEVRYSSDKSNWHEVYLDGDIWMQQRVGSNNVWSSAMRIVSESGTDGVDGKYTVYEFAKNTSIDIAPTSGWQDEPMATSIGEYLWMRSGVVIPPATTPSSWAAVRLKGDKGDQGIQGLQGLQGDNGDQGIQGPKGATGEATYFHIKYSDSANGSNMNETGGAYIGTYVDFTAADSTDPTKYTWVLVKGAQGDQGNQGIAGQNGVNGQTSYLHIAYATSADGTTGFNQTSGTYIGQYVDFTQADSTDPTKYTWTLIKGDKGDTGDKGDKGDTGDTGDSVKLLYRYEIDKPTKPTGSNPNGWSNTPDKEIIAITHGTNFTLKDGYYVSPAISHGSIIKNRIYFSTTKVNQSIAIELSVSSEPTYDCALIGILDDNNLTINSNYTKKISGITTIIAIVDIPNIGSHFIDVGYAKDSSVSNNDDNCKYRIIDINKCWISTGYTISGLTTWSDPVIFINDNKSEEYIYAIEDSEITLASPKSDKYIDDFIPKRTYTDYSQSLTWAIGSEVIYNSNYYRCIIANSSTNVHLPTETLYWKQIEPWTDNPQGVSLTKKYEYISKRTKVNGVWGEFSVPTIWARYSVEGIQGCVLRDSEWVEGTQYLNQSNVKQDGIRYIDIALIANSNATTGWDAYLCLQEHIANASNKPGTTGGNTYWEQFSVNVTAIFTSLIIAKNAKIKFLQGNQLLLMNSDGDIVGGLSGFSTDSDDVRLWIGGSNPATAPYRVMEDGSVVATKMLITGDSEIRGCIISGANTEFGKTIINGGKINTDIIDVKDVVTKGLVAQMVQAATLQTIHNPGEAYIDIHKGIMDVYGTVARNIQFGVNDQGMAVLKYFDNDGRNLYDLGPNGMDTKNLQNAQWLEIQYVRVLSIMQTVPPEGLVSDEDASVLFRLNTTWGLTTLYIYLAGKINNTIVSDSANGFTTAAEAAAANDKLFTARGAGHLANDTYTKNNAGAMYTDNISEEVSKQYWVIQNGVSVIHSWRCSLDRFRWVNGIVDPGPGGLIQ